MCDELFDILNTNAAQLGALLAIASIVDRVDRDPLTHATDLVEAWNAAFDTEIVEGVSTRLVLCNGAKTQIPGTL